MSDKKTEPAEKVTETTTVTHEEAPAEQPKPPTDTTTVTHERPA